MRELYSSEPNLVKLVTSVLGRPLNPLATPVAKLFVGNTATELEEVASLTVNEVDNGEFEIPIPQHLLMGHRLASIISNYELDEYGVFSNNQVYDIARRFVNFEELNDCLGQYAIDYETFTFVETDVRKIIESYCNQDFNSWHGERSVDGENGLIPLSQHLETLTRVRVGSTLRPDFMTEVPGWVIAESGQAIYNPDRDRSIDFFHSKPKKVSYAVEGNWGYTSVPVAINQAAIELAKGFLCDDIEYRRRYIDNIRVVDTRIEFSDKAYEDTTGNPIADQILQPYRIIHYGAV